MNKHRFIDANKLIEDIKAMHYNCTGMRSGKTILAEFLKQYRDDILKTIEDQSTAYSIDEIVKQLEGHAIEFETFGMCSDYVELTHAIKIVKGGAG